MLYTYLTTFHIACLARCLYASSVATPQPTLHLALITDTQEYSGTNWTKVFQEALKLHEKIPHLRQKVNFKLVPVSKQDVRSFGDILDILCHGLLSHRIHAVFLSADNSMAYEFTQFIGLLPVLVLGTNRDPAFKRQELFENYRFVLPPLIRQAEVIEKILDSLEVHNYSILHDMNKENHALANEMISRHKTSTGNVFKAVLPSNNIYHSSAKQKEELIRIKIRGIKVIVLACRQQSVRALFDAANELGMASENFLWIGTESVVRAINGTIEEKSIANLVGIKITTSDKTIALRALRFLSLLVTPPVTDSALTVLATTNGPCSDESQPIPSKTLLSRYPGQANLESSFDQEIPDTYDILKLENKNLLNVRSWRKIGAQLSNGTIQIEDNIFQQTIKHAHRSVSKTLIIVTIEGGQYLYKVGNVIGCEEGNRCTRRSLQHRLIQPTCEIGVPCYEHSNIKNHNTDDMFVFCVSGLMIDLLGLIQNALDFPYELYLVPDGRYGAIDDITGRWNGMIGEVLYGKADMALGTITINAQRSRAVDFTTPYGEVGTAMLVSNGNSARPLITMEFLEPFRTNLWIAILTTILAILIALWSLDRKTRAFYATNAHPLLRKCEKYCKREESVTLLESMSYTWSTFVHVPAGSGFPRSLSARFVAIFFAFAMIILSSTYTANLAANKVKDESEEPITGILDEKMINPPPGFRYGTLKSSSTEAYFKFHRDPRMRKIYQNMKHNNVDDVLDGMEKVKSGEFSVYIDDHPYLEHLVSSQHDCSLRIVGEPFAISGYGLVLGKNSSWTQAISNSILKFSDNNVLAALWSKWLVRKCLRKEDFESVPDRLSIENYNGVFVLVGAGILISVIVLYFERKVACCQEKRQDNFQQELAKEDDNTDNEALTRYFANKFTYKSACLESERGNGARSLSELNFSSVNCTLQLERCGDGQENTLRFNSVC